MHMKTPVLESLLNKVTSQNLWRLLLLLQQNTSHQLRVLFQGDLIISNDFGVSGRAVVTNVSKLK